MAYFHVLLLLFLLPLATAETSDVLKDLRFYQGELQRVAGIKLYIKQYSEIINYMKEMGQYLVDNEKAVVERISCSLNLARDGMDEAMVGVTLIKEQLNTLLILDSVSGTEKQKLDLATQYFSNFAKDKKEVMKKAEELLRQAINDLRKSQRDMGPLLDTLVQLQHKTQGTQGTQILMLAGEIVALGILGGVLGITFSPLIPASLGLVHGIFIQNADDYYWQQQNKIQERKKGYETMSKGLNVLSEGLTAKHAQVREIYAKLTNTGSTARQTAELDLSIEIHYELIQKLAEDLIKACDAFLEK